ncbi:glycosyltransferase [Pontibacter sp. H249]|uniref:glycosyltransferase n=1 Tax=Pontibacter sp. H249 TaxID=3133420 RepID=UPI0030C1889E
MRYLFIYPNNLGRPGYYIQLEPIITYLVGKGHECYVYFGASEDKQVPLKSGINLYTKNDFEQKLTEVDYIYTRNVYDFMPIFSKKLFGRKIKAKLIYNFRGFASYESYYGQRNALKFLFFYILEFFAYKFSNKVSVVSSVFKNELQKHYGYKQDVSVIPCCINEVYKKDKRETDEIRFVYSGSTLKWQKFEETINLYLQISKKLNKTKLTLFTKDTTKADEYIKKINIPNVDVKYLSHNDLLLELRNHDFGFLIRDNVMLNNVASPVKFAEYLACGLIPIVSPGVGDYSELVRDKRIGIVVDKDHKFNYNEINKLLLDDNLFSRIYNTALDLTWEKNLKYFPQ